jgi:hypothetical protein
MAQTTIAPSGAFVTEVFTDHSRAAVLSKMDDRLDALKAEGPPAGAPHRHWPEHALPLRLGTQVQEVLHQHHLIDSGRGG